MDVIDLHQALERLVQSNSDQARIVELHIFGGLSIREVAETLEVSRTTVETRWRFARAWLHDQLGGSER